jgi:hypothetical protein
VHLYTYIINGIMHCIQHHNYVHINTLISVIIQGLCLHRHGYVEWQNQTHKRLTKFTNCNRGGTDLAMNCRLLNLERSQGSLQPANNSAHHEARSPAPASQVKDMGRGTIDVLGCSLKVEVGRLLRSEEPSTEIVLIYTHVTVCVRIYT